MSDTNLGTGSAAPESQDSCEEFIEVLEGLFPDFTAACEADKDNGEPLCGRRECEEVGCVFDKICRAKAAIAKAEGRKPDFLTDSERALIAAREEFRKTNQ